jgi:hypothetical protein
LRLQATSGSPSPPVVSYFQTTGSLVLDLFLTHVYLSELYWTEWW